MIQKYTVKIRRENAHTWDTLNPLTLRETMQYAHAHIYTYDMTAFEIRLFDTDQPGFGTFDVGVMTLTYTKTDGLKAR